MALARDARCAAPALIDGTLGIVVAPHGRLLPVRWREGSTGKSGHDRAAAMY
ncbi:hypothetical protein [Streptomyces endophytica]|uniref:hypothetical protein n=1 Tax=Streptomyces endophytica TaxID=2991496 RepID=UPI00311B0072